MAEDTNTRDINPSSAGQEPPLTDANDTNNNSNIGGMDASSVAQSLINRTRYGAANTNNDNRRRAQTIINLSYPDGGQINVNTNGAANTTRARVINTVRQRVNQHNTQHNNILPPLVPQPVLNQQINNDTVIATYSRTSTSR